MFRKAEVRLLAGAWWVRLLGFLAIGPVLSYPMNVSRFFEMRSVFMGLYPSGNGSGAFGGLRTGNLTVCLGPPNKNKNNLNLNLNFFACFI